MLKLPSYQSLSREQTDIDYLPLDGSHLVVGPPGTGKTIMAIRRAAMIKKKRKRIQFIVYNWTLRQYIQMELKNNEILDQCTVFHTWFCEWYNDNLHQNPPELEKYIYDWVEIFKNIGARVFQKYDHLVIDEGQDLPKEAYTFFQLISTNITVFADENQRIQEHHNSEIKDIKQNLGVERMHLLKRNYRNSLPIAVLASKFYAGLQTGIPELPTRNGRKPHAICAEDLRRQVEYIAGYATDNENKDIAIFVASNKEQYEILKYCQEFKIAGRVQLYVSSARYEHQFIDFAQHGIRLLTYTSSKGLEFDAVFIPSLEKRIPDPESDLEKMRFYVIASRAREDLFFLYSGDELPPLLQGLPAQLFEIRDIRK